MSAPNSTQEKSISRKVVPIRTAFGICLMDVLPTLAEATGTHIDLRRIDGRSLAPFLSGRTPENWREHLLIMHHTSARKVIAAVLVSRIRRPPILSKL